MAGNKNTYLDRQRERDQKFLDAGERMGIQKMWDYIQIALRDPEIMGKDVMGRKRLEKLYKKTAELANYFHTAFTDDVEADYYQEKLDKQLKDLWKERFPPFYERYPQLKRLGYDKARKGWK